MKYFFALLLIISELSAPAQQKTSKVSIGEGVEVIGVIQKFNPADHKIDTCKNKFNDKYICYLDGKKWYGTDQGLYLPRNQLVRLSLRLQGQTIPLNVSGMFNPAYGFDLQSRQFELKSMKNGYMLYAFFSDGAGTYTVHWKIVNGKSSRILISNDEKYFDWQTN